jgi:uncharacterized protein YutE (UPF0331/DUF86 family)
MKLLNSLSRFEKHISGVEKLKGENVSDYLVYNALAMECFQAVNSLIEIGEQLVAKNKLGIPSSYGEVFHLLHSVGIITNEELERARRLVFLRNLIAHEYYRITEKELLDMAELLLAMREFVEKVRKEMI